MHGAIPKSYPQGAAGTAHAEAERIRVFASRRGPITTDPSVRYHEGKREIWRNEERSAGGSTSLMNCMECCWIGIAAQSNTRDSFSC